jgi:hypothetical protein
VIEWAARSGTDPTYSVGREVRDGSWLRENAEIEFVSAGVGCLNKTMEKTILRSFRERAFSRSQGQKLTGSNDRFWREADIQQKTAVVDRLASCAFGSSKWLPITIV